MKKFILTTLITLGFSFHVNATEHGYDFRWQQIPVVCGTSNEVAKYLDDEGFEVVNVSVGREGSNPEGAPVYFVAYYINEAGDQSIAAITSPSGNETCMMYRSFDLTSSKEEV